MRTVIEERVREDGLVDRLVRIEKKRMPLSTSGNGELASDRKTVREVFWVVTLGFNPNLPPHIQRLNPMWGASMKRFETLKAARRAYEAGAP